MRNEQLRRVIMASAGLLAVAVMYAHPLLPTNALAQGQLPDSDKPLILKDDSQQPINPLTPDIVGGGEIPEGHPLIDTSAVTLIDHNYPGSIDCSPTVVQTNEGNKLMAAYHCVDRYIDGEGLDAVIGARDISAATPDQKYQGVEYSCPHEAGHETTDIDVCFVELDRNPPHGLPFAQRTDQKPSQPLIVGHGRTGYYEPISDRLKYGVLQNSTCPEAVNGESCWNGDEGEMGATSCFADSSTGVISYETGQPTVWGAVVRGTCEDDVTKSITISEDLAGDNYNTLMNCANDPDAHPDDCFTVQLVDQPEPPPDPTPEPTPEPEPPFARSDTCNVKQTPQEKIISAVCPNVLGNDETGPRTEVFDNTNSSQVYVHSNGNVQFFGVEGMSTVYLGDGFLYRAEDKDANKNYEGSAHFDIDTEWRVFLPGVTKP